MMGKDIYVVVAENDQPLPESKVNPRPPGAKPTFDERGKMVFEMYANGGNHRKRKNFYQKSRRPLWRVQNSKACFY